MIQIYAKGNKNFENNGNAVLFPTFCKLTAGINDYWEMEISHPLDEDGRWKSITEEAIVSAPTFQTDKQLFYIETVEKTETEVTAKAYPVFYLSAKDCFILDQRPTGKTGQEALDILTAGTKYSGMSNIKKAATAYYVRKNLMEAINSNDENSFINRWGGEILYNNFEIIINDRIGGNYGFEVRYGKNIEGISYKVDMSEVITRIVPVAYNGYTLVGSSPWVDSDKINTYDTIFTKEVKFENVKLKEDAEEEDAENGIIVCETLDILRTELIRQCNDMFEKGVDTPNVEIEIDMVDISKTDDYKDFADLEKVGLGDDVRCRHQKINITTTARAINVVWDCIKNKAEKIKLGSYKNDYFTEISNITDRVNQAIKPDGSLMAERVQGILNGIYTQLKLQSTAAKKVNGRAFMVEDTDPDSGLYGCMVWGTQGLQLSTSRTTDGRDWDWTTAVTAKGIVADAIITGILSDQAGRNYWNLDTGEFRLASDAFQVDDKTVQDYVDGKIDEKIAKIRTLTVQLSNDFQGISTDENGAGGDYTECYTDVQVLIGTVDITNSSETKYTVTPSGGITGVWDAAKKRYTVSYLNSDNGFVDITVSYMNTSLTKRFSISKIKKGADGLNGLQGPKGDRGIQGIKGEDGKTSYTHIAYANSADGTKDFSLGDSNREYIGMYVDFTVADSTKPADYAWSKIKGSDGTQGIPGKPGTDGKTPYFHVAYANSSDGKTGFSVSDSNGKKYIGQYTDFAQADSTDPTKYTWTLIKGADGRTYILQADTLVIKQGADNVFSPAYVNFSAFYRDGTTATRTNYSGRFQIQETTDGKNYVTKYTSKANEQSHTHTPSTPEVKNIRCILFAAGGTTQTLDMQGVAVVRDVDNLTQEEVFNILTENGQLQGIFMQDGKLYVNGEYVQVKDLKAFNATIAGWGINTSDIVKAYNIYPDMTASGLAGVGDNDPVQRWVWMRSPKNETDAVFFVGYKRKVDYLNNVNTVYPAFRARANGATYCKNLTMEGGSINVQSNDYVNSVITLKYDDGVDSGFVEINPYWISFESGGEFHTMGPRTGYVTGKKSGSSQQPKAWIHSDGGITCVSLKQTSDKREKKNINTIKADFAKNFIKNLTPTEFIFLDGEETKHMGFIAQDLQEIITDDYGIITEQNERLSVAYTEIIAPLVKVVQELQEKEEKRCKRWQRLKQLIYKLKEKVSRRKSR